MLYAAMHLTQTTGDDEIPSRTGEKGLGEMYATEAEALLRALRQISKGLERAEAIVEEVLHRKEMDKAAQTI